jgi:hypothetical protein
MIFTTQLSDSPKICFGPEHRKEGKSEPNHVQIPKVKVGSSPNPDQFNNLTLIKSFWTYPVH